MKQLTMTDHALAVRKNAYAPYSGFQVGVALQCTDGSIFTGCNVENASYSMTICAERSAIVQAIAAGNQSFRSIAIVGGKTDEEAKTIPCPPCGACLQVLAEFCDGDFPILLTDGVHKLKEFLPNAFQLT
ncbi:MAG: cytidine deaminase [Ruminococcus sp.]